jgi:NADH-quinone oxidoreductase subunit N
MTNWTIALPEVVLACVGMAILLFGVLRKGQDSTLLCTMFTLGGFLIAGVLVLTRTAGFGFHGQFVADPFSSFNQILILSGSALATILALGWNKAEGISRFEFPVLMLFSTVGMLLMASAGNLMTLYLGLELQSLALYVLAAFQRDDLRSSEAGLKYFVLSGLASGLLLYGISLVYGFSGTMDLASLHSLLVQPNAATPGLVVGIVFVLVGLAFKVSAVPFHMWTPDVYEGAPTSVTVFFATAPKVAAMALLLRVMGTSFASLVGAWQSLVVIVSIASMVLGAFAAIGQTSMKRLMAYSSIGHMGYALIGLAVGTASGGHLRLHDGRHPRLRYGNAAEGSGGRADCRPVGSGVERSWPCIGACGVHVQPGRYPADVWLLCQALYLPCSSAGGSLDTRCHWRADQRGRRLLLYSRHQGDVLRCRG